MSEARFSVEEVEVGNLHCADCAGGLESAVERLSGVSQSKVYLATGRIRVRFDPEILSPESLRSHIERIGYTTQYSHENGSQGASLWSNREVWFTSISGLFLLVGLILTFSGVDLSLLRGDPIAISYADVVLLIAVVFGAFYFVRRGLVAITSLSLNINFLMSIAIVGAIAIGEYVEAASLAFLFSLAELLEEFAVERSRRSLRELIDLTPHTVNVHKDGKEMVLPVEQVEVGDRITVRPGERIALDGEVIWGSSTVNQAAITGESLPIYKQVGDEVFAGTVNIDGVIEFEAKKISTDTTIAKIIHLIEEAQEQKAPSEQFVERFARYYTPAVVLMAIAVATIPAMLFGANFDQWLLRAIALLVIACPCALIISTPVSVISAITSAAKHGVLIKGGRFVEAMGKVSVIAMDKTGTLTLGALHVSDIVPLGGHSEEEVLQIAASLEHGSEHPIAKAILEHASDIDIRTVKDFRSITGKGVVGVVGEKRFSIGTLELFEEHPYKLPLHQIEEFQDSGKTTMILGSTSECWGIITVSDRVRDEAREVVSQLKSRGLQVIMLTGDNEGTARTIAKELGIDRYHASLLPDEKVTEIEHLVQQFGSVAMLGDGINDAPALAASTVGIAMGAAGTDTALETADIALMADDLSKLPYLIDLSQRASVVIKQNVYSSIVVKLALGIGVFPGFVTLVTAVLVGDMGMTLAVTGNALRLSRTSIKKKE